MSIEQFARPSRVCDGLLFGVFLISASTQAGGFRIASGVEGFRSFDSVAINNSGQVAFTAQRFVAGQQVSGAYKASGGGFRTLLEGTYTAADGTVVTGGFRAAINDAGKTAFWFREQVGTSLFASIYTGAGPLSEADFNGGAFPLRLDGRGLVANDLNMNQGGSIEFANHVFIPDPNATGSQVGTIFGMFAMLLDNRNNVLVPGVPLRKIHMGLVTSPGSPHIGPVSTNVIGTVPGGLTASPWAMNGSGTVVFQGSKNGQLAGIYRLGGPIVEVNANSEYDTIGNFAINDNGVVAFYAHSRTLNKSGFFKGPSAVADKILLEGDQVAGVTLSGFSPFPSATRWFNNSGEVVFKALNALWVADSGVSPPDPNSTVIRWNPPVSPPSGSSAIAANWQPSNSDPPRVPQKTTTLNDTALFDLAAAYVVDLGAQHAERLVVKNGDVTFRLGVIKVDALSFDNPSAILDNARLAVSSDGVVTNNHALIGQSAAARLEVHLGGIWTDLGSLVVGGNGNGILTVEGLGSVKSGEARIGTSAAGGLATVGTDGSWNTGDIAIGAGGPGQLTMTNGGRVESIRAVIGENAGIGNVVTVNGSADGMPSFWDTVLLTVGHEGTGRLEVNDGGLVETLDEMTIADKPGVSGSVTVSGVDADSTPSRITAGTLRMGEAGASELLIQNGARFEAQNVLFGDGIGRTDVTVTGVDSLFEVAEELLVGNYTFATLRVEGGAVMSCGSAAIAGGVARPGPSEVKIVGTSSWNIDTLLRVGDDREPSGSSAALTLVGGSVKADSIVVKTIGKIQGFGLLTASEIVNGGTISPGLSPGTLAINGSFRQTSNGRLLLEISGTNSADYDHLIVTNTATLDGELVFRFINAFAPKAGDQFSVMDVNGSISNSFANIGIQNLAPGFQFNIATNGSSLKMIALNDGEFSPALPGQIAITATNMGGISCAIATMTVSNTCDRIALAGALMRTNQSFYQAFEGTTFVRSDCIPTVKSSTNTLILGALPPGDYSFNIVSGGTIIQTIPFTVESQTNRLLNHPALLSNGKLQFQLDGFSPLRYSVEASLNLTDWIELENGSLPSTFVDSDTALHPRRFYRARIFQ